MESLELDGLVVIKLALLPFFTYCWMFNLALLPLY